MMNRRTFLRTTGMAGGLSALPFSLPAQTLQDCPASEGLPVPRTLDHLYRPKPQFWGFDNQDPVLQVGAYWASFQIFTVGPDENSYGLGRDAVKVEREGAIHRVKASRFAGAGQQTAFPGTFEAVFTPAKESISVVIRASANERIRAVKMRLHRLPSPSRVYQTGWRVDPNGLPIVEEGINYIYPEYQGGMPAWQIDSDHTPFGILSTDLEPRPKRLTAYKTADECIVEVVYEEDARRFNHEIVVPAWEIISGAKLKDVIARRAALLELGAGLKRWEDRRDVPEWARKTRLVVTLHGMHWSGYIFNDYDRMLKTVDWVSKRISGEQVLVFIAAWEGRYYRQYGASQADARMGGEAGLRALVEGIHARGARVMPMWSGNYPQPGTPHYEDYAPSSHIDSSYGFRWDPMRGYVVDWGQLRGTGMMGGGPSLNPGAPPWRKFLTEQIARLNEQYGFDGSYFDTQPGSENDAHYSALEGFRQIAADLRSQHKDLLISSESWFDLSLPFVPWSQTPDGPDKWTRKYQRRFAHLSMGEPGRGSTGVHELGHIPYDRPELDRMFDIPTIAFVEDTLELATDEVERVIRAAANTPA